MKTPFFPVACAICLALAGMSGCSNPTKPSPADQAKRNFTALTSSLEKEVEAFRGKNFKRAITVTVFTKQEYQAMVAGQVSSLTPDRRKQLNAIYQCEGLMHKNTDYFAGYDSVMANMTGGFYEDGSDSINIILQDNSAGPTFLDSMTIFHELVHAMQDQYFDLTTLQNNVGSSDQDYALRYVVEGEAELFGMYYSYKLYYGSYPSSSSPVMNAFSRDSGYVESYLDSLHLAGQPLLVRQPMLWAYYSYGPVFINAVAGMNWSVIDNTIFPSLPFRTAEVMHPSTYTTNRKEYLLDVSALTTYVDSANVIADLDELGEMMICVMFREFDNNLYKQIAQGLLADKVLLYHDTLNDSLRLTWFTYWADSATAGNFMTNYASLVNRKKTISLPAPVLQGTRIVIADSVDRVYIEQNGQTVFTIEDYTPAMFSTLIAKMRGVNPYLRTLAKQTGEIRRYPFVDKSALTKGVWRSLNRRRL
jgi:hypothetical protein